MGLRTGTPFIGRCIMSVEDYSKAVSDRSFKEYSARARGDVIAIHRSAGPNRGMGSSGISIRAGRYGLRI